MENYRKGRNCEQELKLSDIPIKDMPRDVLWMKVKPSSKIANLVEYAVTAQNKQHVLWTGVGPSIGKTLSCVEIMKRKLNNYHQVTKIGYVR